MYLTTLTYKGIGNFLSVGNHISWFTLPTKTTKISTPRTMILSRFTNFIILSLTVFYKEYFSKEVCHIYSVFTIFSPKRPNKDLNRTNLLILNWMICNFFYLNWPDRCLKHANWPPACSKWKHCIYMNMMVVSATCTNKKFEIFL